jgi:hypothetical protein
MAGKVVYRMRLLDHDAKITHPVTFPQFRIGQVSGWIGHVRKAERYAVHTQR